MKYLTPEHLIPYLPHNVICSYLEYSDENKRLKAFLTGISIKDGIETTYKRKRRGCSGDLIGFTGNNNITDLKLNLHLNPLSAISEQIEVNGKKLIFANMHLSELELVIINKIGLLGLDLKDHLHWNTINNLYRFHFDVDGLIDKNLAVDKRTV